MWGCEDAKLGNQLRVGPLSLPGHIRHKATCNQPGRVEVHDHGKCAWEADATVSIPREDPKGVGLWLSRRALLETPAKKSPWVEACEPHYMDLASPSSSHPRSYIPACTLLKAVRQDLDMLPARSAVFHFGFALWLSAVAYPWPRPASARATHRARFAAAGCTSPAMTKISFGMV